MKPCNHVDTIGRMKCDRCGLPVEAFGAIVKDEKKVLNVIGYIGDIDLLSLFKPSEDKYFWHINHAITTKKYKNTPNKIRIKVEEV